jgi:SAM-dependent methyltransferase
MKRPRPPLDRAFALGKSVVPIASLAPVPKARRPRAFSFALCAGVLLLAGATAAPAQIVPPHGDEIYRPKAGQSGKDVMWLGSSEKIVAAMLRAAKVGPTDLVVDLGAGDGRIAIAAARDFGARAIGIEYEPPMAELARRNAERAGVSNRVRFITGDIFREDFTAATVVTMYLLPELNLQLRPQILAMKPGTRIVSHAWTMAEWQPDELIRGESMDAYLWIVPARVEGRWTIAEVNGSASATVDIVQRFQRIGGTITIAGETQPLLGAFVSGPDLGFTFVDRDGGLKAVRLTVDGDRATGNSRLDEWAVPLRAERVKRAG